MGGDEFVLLCDKDKIDEFRTTDSSISFSFGIIHKSPEETFREALKKADNEMYIMKKNK